MNHNTNLIDVMIWLQFTWIEEYSSVSSSTYVRNSRRDYDHFLQSIRDYHASMAVEFDVRKQRITKNLRPSSKFAS